MHHLTRYLQLPQTQAGIAAPLRDDLELVLVVPCLCEPGIIELLAHLQQPGAPRAEIIVVVNHAEDAPADVRRCNERTLADIRQWAGAALSVPVHALAAFDLPARHAGVGLARKIGMDAAARRFAAVGRPDGIIASLDADCRVSEHYLQAIWQGFAGQPAMHAATLVYAHPLDRCEDARHRRAMACYELFLRYMALGWRRAGLPYAFTAIGSCFAVRANAYARHHGMNRRKAGEDFYFLHKLAREKPLGHIADACVFPSVRMRSRTPFGTGQAIADWYAQGKEAWLVASPQCFDELAVLHRRLDDLLSMEDVPWLDGMPARLAGYLQRAGLLQAVAGMRRNAASPATFRKHFYTWFDGLKAWRYVQQCQVQLPVEQAVCRLLTHFGIDAVSRDVEGLLQQLRRLKN